MKTDDILLLAYVDDELAPPERDAVEREIGASSDLAERVAHLQASRLPYQSAFAAQKLPPVPDSLKQKIAELAQAAQSTPSAESAAQSQSDAHPQPAASANDPLLQHDATLPPSTPVRSRLRVAPTWLAVAFIAGAFCCGVVLRFGPGSPSGASGAFSVSGSGGPGNATVASASSSDALPWIKAAVNYQQLFTRDTIAYADPDPARLAKTVDAIREEDGVTVRVPDLSGAGLAFKGVQRLRFHDKPLVQLVYLPQKGVPVALCVIKDTRPDQHIAEQRVDGMKVVTWRQAQLGYALIGAPDDVDLSALAKQISTRSVNAMFGRTTVPDETPAG